MLIDTDYERHYAGYTHRMFVTDGHEVVFMPIVPRRSFIPSVGGRSTIITRQVPALNISTRKIGGLRFIKVGRLCVSFCITSSYRSL